jgi:hypothetical protein
MKRAISLAIFIISLCTFAQGNRFTAREAKDHVGEVATVCGKVASAHFASATKGQPTFLNLDEPYPKEIFTALIWGSDRGKFGNPESKYRDARICVTGRVSSYRGTPEIVVSEPTQIVIQE